MAAKAQFARMGMPSSIIPSRMQITSARRISANVRPLRLVELSEHACGAPPIPVLRLGVAFDELTYDRLKCENRLRLSRFTLIDADLHLPQDITAGVASLGERDHRVSADRMPHLAITQALYDEPGFLPLTEMRRPKPGSRVSQISKRRLRGCAVSTSFDVRAFFMRTCVAHTIKEIRSVDLVRCSRISEDVWPVSKP